MGAREENFHSESGTWTFEAIWNRQLDLQVRAFFSADKKFLDTLPGFKKAQAVLEIGSGNGAFLINLAKAFPGKTYRGIDASAELTKHARLRTQHVHDVTFSVEDLYRLGPESGQYDVIFARLVIQHLPDLHGFIKVASSLLSPGGQLILIECEDDRIGFTPDCPRVTTMMKAARKRQPAGGPKAAIQQVKRAARKNGFSLTQDRVVIRAITGSARATARQLWENTGRLIETVYKTSANVPELRRQLMKWEQTPGSEARMGYRYVIFRKGGFSPLRFLRLLSRWGS